MHDRPILIWYWGRFGAGPLITKLLIERLIEAGFGDRLVVSLSENSEMYGETASLGLPLHSLPTLKGNASLSHLISRIPALRAEMKELVNEVRPQTVIVPMMFGALLPVLDLVRRATDRLVYVAHDAQRHPGDQTGRLQHLAQARIIRSSDQVVAPSNFVAAQLKRLYPQSADRIVHEPLASLYRPSGSARGPLPEDRPIRFLVPGRLVRYKGFERLAAALHLLSAARLEVTVTGDGPYRSQVEALLTPFQSVHLALRWWGPHEQAALYNQHDMLLCPYDEASQSGTICEALAAAMPSLVTPVGALPEQIDGNRAGIVLPGMAPEDLAEAIRNMAAGAINYQALSAGCLSILDRARRTSKWANLV